MSKAVFSTENQPPARVSVSGRVRTVFSILCLAILACVSCPQEARAVTDTIYQYPQVGPPPMDMALLQAAINGDAAAIAKLDTITAPVQQVDPATGQPIQLCDNNRGVITCTPMTSPGGQNLVNQIVAAMAGTTAPPWVGPLATVFPPQTTSPPSLPVLPASTSAPADIATASNLAGAAAGGDFAALQTIQRSFVANNFFEGLGEKPLYQPNPLCRPPVPLVGANPCLIPTGQNLLADSLAYIAAGTGPTGLQTIGAASDGDPAAKAILTVVFSRPPVPQKTDITGGVQACSDCNEGCVEACKPFPLNSPCGASCIANGTYTPPGSPPQTLSGNYAVTGTDASGNPFARNLVVPAGGCTAICASVTTPMTWAACLSTTCDNDKSQTLYDNLNSVLSNVLPTLLNPDGTPVTNPDGSAVSTLSDLINLALANPPNVAAQSALSLLLSNYLNGIKNQPGVPDQPGAKDYCAVNDQNGCGFVGYSAVSFLQSAATSLPAPPAPGQLPKPTPFDPGVPAGGPQVPPPGAPGGGSLNQGSGGGTTGLPLIPAGNVNGWDGNNYITLGVDMCGISAGLNIPLPPDIGRAPPNGGGCVDTTSPNQGATRPAQAIQVRLGPLLLLVAWPRAGEPVQVFAPNGRLFRTLPPMTDAQQPIIGPPVIPAPVSGWQSRRGCPKGFKCQDCLPTMAAACAPPTTLPEPWTNLPGALPGGVNGGSANCGTGGGTGGGPGGGTGNNGVGDPPCDLSDETADDFAPLHALGNSAFKFNPDPCLLRNFTDPPGPQTDDDGLDSAGNKIPSLTRLTRNLDFAKNYEGGEQWTKWFPGWVTEQWLPSWKNLTVQMNAALIDQTRQIGSTFDSIDMSKAATGQQRQQSQHVIDNAPSELACVAASPVSGMSLSGSVANAMTGAMQHDGNMVSGTGIIPATDFSGAGPAAAAMPTPGYGVGLIATVQNNEWNQYCRLFFNATDNNGWSACPAAAGGTPTIPNGDIDVEGLLLKDTIDLSKPEQLAAAEALMRRLVEPRLEERVPDEVIAMPSAHERILLMQHVKAARSLAADAVANIVARRMAIVYPAPEAQPPPTPPLAGASVADAGPPGKTFRGFLGALGMAMSSGNYHLRSHSFEKKADPNKGTMIFGNYLGAYGLGEKDLTDIGCVTADDNAEDNNYGAGSAGTPHTDVKASDAGNWTGSADCGGAKSTQEFLDSADGQDSAIVKVLESRWNALAGAGAAQMCQMFTMQDGRNVLITPSGLLSMAWLVGVPGVQQFLSTGVDVQDGNGASGMSRLTQQGGYALPWGGVPGDGTCTPEVNQAHKGLLAAQNGKPPEPGDPPIPDPAQPQGAPKPVDQVVKEIRQKAGIDPARLADPYKPSYNEVMLAMTKERFLSPDYYTRIGDDISALQQEQTAVNAYVTIELKDVYDLQEQINALLAARASLKFNNPSHAKKNRIEMLQMR